MIFKWQHFDTCNKLLIVSFGLSLIWFVGASYRFCSPDVILLAKSLPVAHKARVGLVQQHLALRTLQVEHFLWDTIYFLLLERQCLIVDREFEHLFAIEAKSDQNSTQNARNMLIWRHTAPAGHLETGGMPGEVGRDPEYELVLDETPTAYTGTAPITWNKTSL